MPNLNIKKPDITCLQENPAVNTDEGKRLTGCGPSSLKAKGTLPKLEQNPTDFLRAHIQKKVHLGDW